MAVPDERRSCGRGIRTTGGGWPGRHGRDLGFAELTVAGWDDGGVGEGRRLAQLEPRVRGVQTVARWPVSLTGLRGWRGWGARAWVNVSIPDALEWSHSVRRFFATGGISMAAYFLENLKFSLSVFTSRTKAVIPPWSLRWKTMSPLDMANASP